MHDGWKAQGGGGGHMEPCSDGDRAASVVQSEWRGGAAYEGAQREGGEIEGQSRKGQEGRGRQLCWAALAGGS